MHQGRHLQKDPSMSRPPMIPPRPSMESLLTADEVNTALDGSGTQDFPSFSVLCMHDFESEEAGLLPFRRNEILDVIKRDESGWWAAMRKSKSKGSRIGWIPQAYVTVLSEELANKLRSVEKPFRVREYEAAMTYNGSSPLTDDSPSPSPLDDDPCSKLFSLDHRPSTDGLTKGRENQYSHPPSVNRNVFSSVSLSSSGPLPPSRSASFKKTWKPQPTSDTETRPRTTSLTARSRRVGIHATETLGRLTNRTETPTPKELSRMSSRNLSGTSEPLQRRGDDKRRQKASEENLTTQLTPLPFLRLPQKYELDEDNRGRVRSGSLPALVERLTTPETDLIKMPENKIFTTIFLMTFRTFTTADILFDMLLDRHHILPPNNMSDTLCAEWIIRVRLPLRLRVLEVFNLWLEDHRLLEEEPHIARQLSHFLTNLDDQALSGTAERILETLKRLTFVIPNKPTTTVSGRKARKSRAYKNDLLKMDAVDIAEQLTLLEFGLYVKITPQECLAYAKSQSGHAVVNLLAFCGTHDKVASWVKTSVLNHEALLKRSDTIDFWIKVAEKCRLLSNFSSMSAIITALDSTVLTQLKLTWFHAGKKSILDALLRHNEPTGGFSGYRTLLHQVEVSCVPFIAMYLTDIVHVSEHYKQEGDTIFFFQRARWYEIITNMLKFQSRPYRVAPSDATMAYIESHLREAERNEEWFWRRSQELQHEEIANEDIRKRLEAAGF